MTTDMILPLFSLSIILLVIFVSMSALRRRTCSKWDEALIEFDMPQDGIVFLVNKKSGTTTGDSGYIGEYETLGEADQIARDVASGCAQEDDAEWLSVEITRLDNNEQEEFLIFAYEVRR